MASKTANKYFKAAWPLLLLLCGCVPTVPQEEGTENPVIGEYSRGELSSTFWLHIQKDGEFELYEVDLTANTQRSVSGSWELEGQALKLQPSSGGKAEASIFIYQKNDGDEWLIPKKEYGKGLSEQVYDRSYRKEAED